MEPTRGNWTWYWHTVPDNDLLTQADCGIVANGVSVFRCPRYASQSKWEADARLACASKDLLAALQSTLQLARLKWGNLDGDANKVFGAAEAAIAKATAP